MGKLNKDNYKDEDTDDEDEEVQKKFNASKKVVCPKCGSIFIFLIDSYQFQKRRFLIHIKTKRSI